LNRFQYALEKAWYKPHLSGLSCLLWPLSLLFWLLSRIDKQIKEAKQEALPTKAGVNIPVVVVGNISVGGTGKTPLSIALVSLLNRHKLKVGVISRGYGGQASYPYVLDSNSTAQEAGDEPLLIYQRSQCPVVVDPNRRQALNTLLASFPEVDVVLSDDGMQHHALSRDIEIAVIDGQRLLGNQQLLPAGPLREPVSRLNTVDFILFNGTPNRPVHFNASESPEACVPSSAMLLQSSALQALHEHQGASQSAPSPKHQPKVHAVAAIGNPERFFQSLEDLGFECIRHPFDDHHAFSQSDILFDDDFPVIMTEKDAVKCRNFSQLDRHFYLPIDAKLSQSFETGFVQRIEHIRQTPRDAAGH